MRSLASSSAILAGVACTTCALVALAVAAAGQASPARRELAFGFSGPSRHLGDALDLAVHNGRYVAAVLVACLAIRWAPTIRWVIDAGLAGLLVLNAALIGLALGAYGARLVAALAVHGTLELAAFSLSGGAYLRVRHGAMRRRHFAGAMGGALGLLALAAVAETWFALGAVR